MPNGTYGGVRGRKTKVGRKLSFSSYSIRPARTYSNGRKSPNLCKLTHVADIFPGSKRDKDIGGAQ